MCPALIFWVKGSIFFPFSFVSHLYRYVHVVDDTYYHAHVKLQEMKAVEEAMIGWRRNLAKEARGRRYEKDVEVLGQGIFEI